MKILINYSNYLELISELNTKDKPVFGSGVEHKIFESWRYPDRVYKIGPERSVKRWINIFKSNPDMFPTIYKVDTLKGKNLERFLSYMDDYYYDEAYYYVMIEKLSTRDFFKFWMEIEGQLNKMLKDDYTELDDISYDFKENESTWIDLLNFIKSRKPKLFPKSQELYNLLVKLNQIIEIPDVHALQFGFDSSGKIKCLDI
jgi:hypothetical protein